MKYAITVCRIGYSYEKIEVEADTKEEAESKALSVAPDHEFTNEKDSDYVLEDGPTKRHIGYFSESPIAKNPDAEQLFFNELGSDIGYQDSDGCAIVTVDDLSTMIDSADDADEPWVAATAELLGWANKNDITYINTGM